MRKGWIYLAVLALAVAGIFLAWQGRGIVQRAAKFKDYVMNDVRDESESAKRAREYFHDWKPDYDPDLWRVAERIGANEVPTDEEIAAIKNKINTRAKDDMTLLFLAAWSSTLYERGSPKYEADLAAMDKLLANGANPYLPDRLARDGTDRLDPDVNENFASYAAGITPESTDYLRLYLKNGGDPNAVVQIDGTTMAKQVATYGNFDGFKLLVDAGADVFRYSKGTTPLFPLMSAGLMERYDFIEYAIGKGVLRGVDDKRIADLIDSIDSYSLRNDQTSRDMVRVVRRIIEITGYRGDQHSEKILAFGTQHGW